MSIVSIIVAIYNEEKNIERCIINLSKQDLSEVEVIFINDGSNDNSLSLINNNINKLKCDVKVINQENQGAASARYNAILMAESEYITILDCDDYYSLDYIGVLKNNILKNKSVDIFMPDMRIQNKNGNFKKLKFYNDEIYLKGYDCLLNSFGGWLVHGCNCFRKEIFLSSYKIYFEYNKNNENYINNDEVITRLNFMNSEKVMKICCSYYYVYNEFSTTKKLNSKKFLMLRNSIIMCNIFHNNDSKLIKKVLEELLITSFGMLKYYYINFSRIQNKLDWENMIYESICYLSINMKPMKFFGKNYLKIVMMKFWGFIKC